MVYRPLYRSDVRVYINSEEVPHVKNVKCSQEHEILSGNPLELQLAAHKIVLNIPLFHGMDLIRFRALVSFELKVVNPFSQITYSNAQVQAYEMYLCEGDSYLKLTICAPSRSDEYPD